MSPPNTLRPYRFRFEGIDGRPIVVSFGNADLWSLMGQLADIHRPESHWQALLKRVRRPGKFGRHDCNLLYGGCTDARLNADDLFSCISEEARP
jgi:hypothetical protein